ncbi:unnamed protein product [Rhizophagus irregularis]|uniref:Uncharacterized protein n=1 Tax=Rhizophagus irregularis TaxID=588596 RepID=A0A2N1ME33_9GLOM|nr:hypothetical protein RhiirC2_794143 [Rhizophagus irregularis]CAB5393060.1 unnamed protein product [Rhizophagus irregularis]
MTGTADNDISASLSVPSSNCTSVDFLPSTTASALLYDNIQQSFYTFTLRNCYFLLDPAPDLDNCYTIYTNSSLLSINRIPSHTWRKYFNKLRQLLLMQRVTSLARWLSSHRNNRRTHTFIQFRYRQSCFYLGLYFGCPHCKTPAAYIMFRFHHACYIHNKKLI